MRENLFNRDTSSSICINVSLTIGYLVKSRAGTVHRFWIDLWSVLSLEFNSRWRSNLVFIRTLKCSRRRALVRESVISPLLRMLLWREINVNTAHCEHPCNSRQPFLILWMIILGSSVCKDLETSRLRLFLKACSAFCCSKLSSESIPEESQCIRKIPESILNHFSIRDASIYCPSPSKKMTLIWRFNVKLWQYTVNIRLIMINYF